MTVGVGIRCSNGIVLACDSLTTFGRGVPVLRYSNKVHILKHDKLENEVAIIAAGMTAYFDKFRDRACRTMIGAAHDIIKPQRKLDIVDFAEHVCEPIMIALLKEYAFDRNKFLGAPISEFSLSLIVAGVTRDKDLRAYLLHGSGLAEPIDHYGTIGSGAAYAELFLRFMLTERTMTAERVGELSVYAVNGVALMDPHVGGEANVKLLTLDKDGKLTISDLANKPPSPTERMEQVLKDIGKSVSTLAGGKDGRIEKAKK